MIRKALFIVSLLLMTVVITAKAQSAVGDWQLHPTCDNFYEKVIDTPSRVYFQIPGAGTYSANGYNEKRCSLFVYDKEADEILAYTSRNYLTEDIISYMTYNYDKGYLLIVYINSNIDILYDDDTVYNIPGYASSILAIDKSINQATFDDANNRVYLATDFGYLVLNDEKYEIAESHIYNTQINAVGRVGDNLILLTPTNSYKSPISDPHLSLSSFSVIEGITGASFLMPLSDNTFAFGNPKLQKATLNDDGTATVELLRQYNNVNACHECSDGSYFILEDMTCTMLYKDGSIKSISIPEENYSQKFSSSDFKEFWFAYPRKGMGSKSYDSSAKTWTVTREYAMPDAPAVYYSFYPTYSEKYGMVLGHEGVNYDFSTNWLNLGIRISGYKNGIWTNYGPLYISQNPLRSCIADPHGPTFDPEAPNFAYIGTYTHGFTRMNFDDPNDIQVYSYATDSYKDNDGFHAVFPASTWAYCHVAKPDFDSNNTMWLYHESSYVKNGIPGFWYWKSEDRKSNNAAGIKKIDVPSMSIGPYTYFIALKKNKNILIQCGGNYENPIVVFDHNGTLDDTSDDRVVNLAKIFDQDGNSIPFTYVKRFFEDPNTGKVWVATFNGVFCFNPQEAFNSDFRAQRIKVARNDGTNLADYLLDGIIVYDIQQDGAGRKWFATGGSGVVITSSDGSEIIRQLTTENSYLPHDIVYGIGIDPTSNSVFLSTYYGIAEYFSDATPAEPTYDNVIAYPNPVRPDYLGWVTIEGLMESSLVKIVDAAGGFVKDLGVSQGGMITWDVTNEQGNRVKTGVYYVVASQSTDGSSSAKVTKILVVN